MINVDCDTIDIPLQLPSCARSIDRAYMFRPHGLKRDLTVILDPITPGIVRLSNLPTDAPRGVYTLAVQTCCGCFTTLVWINCEAPALPGTHYPTNPLGLAKVCCDPIPAIVSIVGIGLMINTELSFVFPETADLFIVDIGLVIEPGINGSNSVTSDFSLAITDLNLVITHV